MNKKTGLTAMLMALVAAAPAVAAEPAALVEDVAEARTDVMLMDILEPGTVIELAAGEKLVLSYLASCRQESITGGIVTVGNRESAVAGGKVKAKTVPCDSAAVAATGDEAGAVVFRAPPGGEDLPKPDATIYSLYPILKTDPAAAEALLVRLDKREKDRRVRLDNGVADFRDLKTRLDRSARYRVTAGERSAVFLIDAKAKSSEKAVISRLVRF